MKMKNYFSIECENYYGLATFQVYIMNHVDNLTWIDNAKRLSRSKPLRCCFDTGSNYTVVSREVANTLTQNPNRNHVIIESSNVVSKSGLYCIDILFPNDVVIPGVEVGATVNRVDVLIGMDIIGLGDFALSTRNGHPFLSFYIPHRYELDLTPKK